MKSLYKSTGRINDINTVLEAIAQALEALEAQHVEHFMSIRVGAIAALREVLEAQEPWTPNDMAYCPRGLSQSAAVEQEPVAYLHCGGQFGGELDEWEIDPEQHQCDKLNEQFGALGKEARIPLYTAPQPAAAEQGLVAHDNDLLEQLYWELDHQRQKTGDERSAFKGKMRFYASEFRRRSMGKMAFAHSVSDDMMNLADRLGMEYDDVDPRAWEHLLVYAPRPARRPLTDAQLASACLSYRHDFGLLSKKEQESLIFQAREWERALEKEREIGGEA